MTESPVSSPDETARPAIRTHAYQAIGPRDEQQDAYAIEPHCAVIADGMGGHDGGAEAAQAAVAAVLLELGEGGDRDALESAFSWACREVRAASPGGTTLVVLDFASGLLAWVGDSRAYLVRDGEAKLLTDDHVAEDGGLTRWIPDEGVPDFVALDLQSGDRVVLCTDGVTGVLEEADIAAAALEADDPAEWLVEQALSEGTWDNCTAVVCTVG